MIRIEKNKIRFHYDAEELWIDDEPGAKDSAANQAEGECEGKETSTFAAY